MFVLRLLTLGLAATSPALACEADGPGQRMALDGGGALQMDASLRLRSMYYDPTRFGVQGGKEDGYGLLRALASIRAQRGGWQTVAQLGVHAEQGRSGGAGGTDRGALDVQQAYVHWQGEHLGWQLADRKPAMAVRGCCRCATGRTSAWRSTACAAAGARRACRWT